MIIISGIPYNSSLTDEQKAQLPFGLFPLTEAHFYDFDQSSVSGISANFPSGDLDFLRKNSWLYETQEPAYVVVDESGRPINDQSILNYIELSGNFSLFDPSGVDSYFFGISGNIQNNTKPLQNNLFNDWIYYNPAFSAQDGVFGPDPSGVSDSDNRELRIPYLANVVKNKSSLNPYKF